MATDTIPGGAYKVGDTWVDAWGKPLEKEQVAEAERVQTERQREADEAEQQRLALEAAQNPFTRALAGLQPQQRAAEAPPRTEKAR